MSCEGGDSDAHAEDVNLNDVLIENGVDIDLFEDDAGAADAADATIAEHTVDGRAFADAGTIETDLDQSVQVIAGELQPVVSSALVVNQKTTEIAEYYPAIDSLDSTQSNFDLDIPNASAPGGFIRRWYIRGAAFVKRVWRRLRRAQSS